MSWTVVGQISGLIILYIGGIIGIAHYVSSASGKSIDVLGKSIDDLRADMVGLRTEIRDDIKGLRSEMKAEHAVLANKVDALANIVSEHISNHETHKG